MMFITGPLYSGKRTFARNFRGSVIADVQDAAAETQTPEQLETLARELAEYDIVIATEVGGGVVPMDACLLYTSPSPRDGLLSRMPSSA